MVLNKIYNKNYIYKNISKNFSFIGSVKFLSIAIVFILFSFYVGMEIMNRYGKPDLFVVSPGDNYITNKKEISVIGKTTKNTYVSINGESILIDDFGGFTKNIILNDGLNIIKITAAKDRGAENIIIKRIIFEENQAFASGVNVINEHDFIR